MTNERKAELFDKALTWIWEHTEGYSQDEYVSALKHIGFTPKEIKEELENCVFD